MMSYGIRDPSALLRPWKSLQHFTEELYAMLMAGAPRENLASPTVAPANPEEQGGNVRRPLPADEPARAKQGSVRQERLAQARARQATPEVWQRDSHASAPRHPSVTTQEPGRVSRGPETPTTATPAPSPAGDAHARTRRISQSDKTSQDVVSPPAAPARRSNPAGPVDSAPRFSIPSVEPAAQRADRNEGGRAANLSEKSYRNSYHPKAPEFSEVPKSTKVPFGDTAQVPMGVGGTSLLIGEVTAYDEEGVHVTTYSNGPDQDPDPAEIIVNIPGLASNAVFPPHYWLYDIYTFQDANGNTLYYANPPMWVA